MTYFVELLMKNWKIALIAMAIASCLAFSWLQTTRLNAAKAELAEIQSVADAAQTQTEANLEHLQKVIPLMVDQAKEGAVRAYCNRHPSRCRNHIDRPAPVGLRPQGCDGQAPSTINFDAAGTDPIPFGLDTELIEQCAHTTALYNAWREVCARNPALCEVKK